MCTLLTMKCDECNSGYGYLRTKKGEWICRVCGETTPLKKTENKPEG